DVEVESLRRRKTSAIARAADELGPRPAAARAERVETRVVQTPHQLADDVRVRSARRVAEAHTEQILGQSPRADHVEVVTAIVPGEIAQTVRLLARRDGVRVRDPAAERT